MAGRTVEAARASLPERRGGGHQAVAGGRWAAYNGALDRLVISLDPGKPDPGDLVEVVNQTVGPYGPWRSLVDLDSGWADAVALGGEVLAVGAGLG